MTLWEREWVIKQFLGALSDLQGDFPVTADQIERYTLKLLDLVHTQLDEMDGGDIDTLYDAWAGQL